MTDSKVPALYSTREAMKRAGVPNWQMGGGVSSADAIDFIAKQRDEVQREIIESAYLDEASGLPRPMMLRVYRTDALDRGWVHLYPPPKYVCCECGAECADFDAPCPVCTSLRVITIEVIIQALGDSWVEAF